MKTCTKCCTEKSLISFHKKVGGKYGVHAECKTCFSKRRRANYLKTKDKQLAKIKEYAVKNKETIKKYQKKYREDNKEKRAEYRLEYWEENKKSLGMKAKVWYQKNKEEIINRVLIYQKNNRHINNAAGAKYRAAKLQATPVWRDDELINDMYQEAKYFGGHIDHMVPLQSKLVCGLHWEGNLQFLSASDNCSKSNVHWPDMWEKAA